MSQPDLDFPLGSGTPSLDDSIISDVSMLEIDTEQIIESDVGRDFRVSSIIKGSLTGVELLNNIEKHCPRTGAKFGKTLVINRCVKFFISINKLSKPSFNNGWRSTSEESRNTVEELFNCITRDTDEWKALLKALFFGVEIRAPKAQLKRKSPETSHDGAASILEQPLARVCDRVALLACALVDPRFNEQWVDLAAPVSAEKRPAVMDKNIIHVINAKWTVLAEAIMENRLNYENIYYDLKVKDDIKPCLIIFHYINFIFYFSL